MKKQIYKCNCGLWSRKDCKILTDGQPICRCGDVMRKGFRDIKEIPDIQKQYDIILRTQKRKGLPASMKITVDELEAEVRLHGTGTEAQERIARKYNMSPLSVEARIRKEGL